MPSPGPASPCGVDITRYYVDHNHDDRYPRTDNAKIAYAWMCLQATAIGVATDLAPCTSIGYHFNPAGQVITVTRSAVGRYDVVFNGLDLTGGHAQVSAYGGDDANHCKPRAWGANHVLVDCWTPTGDRVDSRFSLLFMD